MTKKVAIFLTNHSTLGDTDQVNGTFAPELTHVVDLLNRAGIDYDLISIQGGAAPIYGIDQEGDVANARVFSDPEFNSRVSSTLPAADVNIEEYAAIFYPGGFGLLSDLAENQQVADLAAEHYEAGGIISAVCHGPACLLPIVLSNGEKLLASKSVTCFTREEEIDYNTINDIPFLAEEALARSAARFTKAQPWEEFVVRDDRLITGQNPTSAHALGETLVEMLQT